MKRSFRSIQWPAVFWLTIVWVLLWGDLSAANVLGGAALGILIMVVFPLPSIDYAGRFRPVYVIALFVSFLRELVVASFQVAWLALRVNHQPRSAVVRVKLRSTSDLYLTLTAEMSSLVPGSLVIEAHRLTSTLYLHVLDIDHSGGADAVRDHVLVLEERVLKALASDQELADAGVSLRRRRGADPALNEGEAS
ncbi:Na+/H+ antiporter subunit E [Jonesia quinghaiensis]|uniref:Na+/H+ antiporter subunit E n=1 Tax=Jonesia quinghaiensis TaxID=262806 RepID=UPI000422B6FA|nr:Na+/H+ antiporter subunit E [Jonesia quinghaiensis]